VRAGGGEGDEAEAGPIAWHPRRSPPARDEGILRLDNPLRREGDPGRRIFIS